MSTAAIVTIIILLAIIGVLIYILARMATAMHEGVSDVWNDEKPRADAVDIHELIARHDQSVKSDISDGLRRLRFKP